MDLFSREKEVMKSPERISPYSVEIRVVANSNDSIFDYQSHR
jgi:hypothetical protein